VDAVQDRLNPDQSLRNMLIGHKEPLCGRTTSSAAAAALRAAMSRRTKIAAAVCCSSLFGLRFAQEPKTVRFARVESIEG